MEILLSEDVPGLGDMGEKVKVRGGYARNFLIPRGIAVEAGASNVAALEHKRRGIESKKRKAKVGAEELSAKLGKVQITIGLRVASGGKVFGSIRRKDISDALEQLGYPIDRRRVLLEEPIRTIGTHSVKVKLHSDVISLVTLNVEKLEASKEEEETETTMARSKMAAAAQQAADEAEVLGDME
jgi:large subunit ribosomal protein L9